MITTKTVELQAAPAPGAGWSALALTIAALVLLPILSVGILALGAQSNVWPHLWATTLPRYLLNTVVVMTGVGFLAGAIGAGAAWLVVMYRFPGRAALQWMLLLPMAVPGYVAAYALVDFLEYAGPVQTGLRALMGWQSAADYFVPQVRSRPVAIGVLALSLYPYVYLLTRAALSEQSGTLFEAARSLRAGAWARFWRVGLPLVRPALAAGVAVCMMETVNDFGTVDYFAVQTLTTGIFTIWLEAGNPAGAAQIAVLILGMIALLVGIERGARRRARFHRPARGARPMTPVQLGRGQGALATLFCVLPVGLGFVLPVGIMISHALENMDVWRAPGLALALTRTLVVAGVGAVLVTGLSLLMVYGARLGRGRLAQALIPVTAIGYAAPGAVLGVGLLLPLAAFDHRVADLVEQVFGLRMGLFFTGSVAALILAYVVRFFAIGQGAADGALGRIPPSLPLAARTLGVAPRGVLRRVHLPLMRRSVGTALLLVFVDCVKELPATLLLRPFGFNTLATRTYERASLEQIGEAAPAALLVVAVGALAVWILVRANFRETHG